MQRHAEIAGAGFAGMTAAAALAQRGWSVRVHERAPEAREFGAGIWTWENGVRVLNAIGAADEAFEGALRIPSRESRNKRGQRVNYFEFGTHESGGRIFCVTGRHLHSAVLIAALRSGVEVVTSSKALGATPEGGPRDRRRWGLLQRPRFVEVTQASAAPHQRRHPRQRPSQSGRGGSPDVGSDHRLLERQPVVSQDVV